MDFWEAENAWYLHAPVSRLAKAVAQWEVYESVLSLPGEVAEFGTYKAASLIRLATFRDIAESGQSRRIVAFDAFGAFPTPKETASDDEVAFVERFEAEGGQGLSVEETEAALAAKGFTNIELVAGDISATLPDYLRQHPELRLALVHIDVDLHDVTRLVLEMTGSLLVRGGAFMLDDYGKVGGATRAVDEFLVDNPDFALTRTPFSYAPSILQRVNEPAAG